MAHDPVHTCSPQNIYGPFKQTQFLGLSILSFTANAGINEQVSEVTIELVRDLCVSNKRHYDTSTFPFNTPVDRDEADPGFTNPVLGCPCFFRVADFEYSGILQSWNEKAGPDGFPVYTVKLTDPRVLLDNVQIILSEYQGGLKGLSPDPSLPVVFPDHINTNIINVYGFLDSIIANCAFIDAGSGGFYDEVWFGAPAGGWGISTGLNAGIPWNYLKRAVQALLGDRLGYSDPTLLNAPNFSIGYVSGPPGNINGYGEIFTSGTSGLLAVPAKYLLDLSEIPDAPDYYRVSGPIITASELISQVCRDAGCDYYIELLPIAQYLVIKVRVIIRRNQPNMTGDDYGIQKFIAAAATPGGSTTATLGKEYRPNPNNAFIIGDKKRSVYRHSGDGAKDPNQHLNPGQTTGVLRTIQPYWGRDLDGKLQPAYETTCEINGIDHPPRAADAWFGPPDWMVRLDFRAVNALLTHKMTDELPGHFGPKYAWTQLVPEGKGWVWEGEMRAAMGSLQDFINFLLAPNPYCLPAFDRKTLLGDSTALRLWAQDINLGYQGTVTRPPIIGGLAGAAQPTTPPTQVFLAAVRTMVGTTGPSGPGSEYLKDAQQVHQWLRTYAQEHYGRKWLVKIPFACYAGDTGNPDLLRWTDEPSPEGGWSEDLNIIELENSTKHSIAMDVFKTEDGRIGPILRWTMNAPAQTPICGRVPCVTGLDFSQVPLPNMVTNLQNWQATQGPDLYVWQKAEIDDNWVTGSPYVGSNQSGAWALLTCDPIYTGFAVADGKREPDNFIVRSGLRDKDINFSGNISPMIGVAGAFSNRMIHPLAAAIPVLSNTQTYGPWWKEAVMANSAESYGTVFAEQDTTLSPWEYGSSESMNIGALTKIENATTQMTVAERGEVTVPGYPTIGLGGAITSSINLIEARFIADDNTFFGYNFSYVTGVGLGSQGGAASVSNMNVVVSPQGVTTSYTISTFTPVFGRFSENNAERIKKIGRNKLRNDRALRRKLGKNILGGRSAANRAHTLLSKTAAGPARAPDGGGVLLAGRIADHDRRRKSVVIADRNTFAFYADYANTAMMSIDGLLRPVAKTGARIPNSTRALGGVGLPAMKSYTDGAFMDASGQFGYCPYTGFPGLLDKDVVGQTGSGGALYSGFPIGVRYKNLYASIQPPPPIPQVTGIVVAASYLDPLADYVSNSGFVTLPRATGSLGTGLGDFNAYASGHDIEACARGDLSGLEAISTSGWTGQCMIIAGEADRYGGSMTDDFGKPSESGSGDYRFMALKGPLVLHSWGYDTYGKPIPNSRGYSGDPSFTGVGEIPLDTGNTHQRTQSGLTDRFAPNWLSDATNWPVAPVDLRFDRARGVWTTPQPFRLMKVQALQDIDAGETGIVEVLTGGDMYNEDGLSFDEMTAASGSGADGLMYQTGLPPCFSLVHGADINSGDILVTHYDTYSCEHWVVGGHSSGGGEGVSASFPVIGDFVCEGDIITTTSTTLTFQNGSLVSTG